MPPPPVETMPAQSPAPAATPERVNLFSEYEKCLHAQRTGDLTGARECYARFLPTALRQGGIPEGDVGQVTAQLTRFPEPAAVYPTSTGKSEAPRRNAGLWGAGLSMWLCAMVPTFVAAPLSAAKDSGDRKGIYYSLMIPVLGPFISGIWLPVAAKAKADSEIVITYTVPWIVADGLTQLVGMTMFAIGVQQRPLPPRLARYLKDVRVAPYAGGQSIGITGTF